MAKLLQRKRRILIKNKNTKDYLLYAIGEIVLVVIGILIAVQLNNWNEQRKLQAKEITMLKDLQTSLTAAVEQLDMNANGFEYSADNLYFIKSHLQEQKPINDSVKTALMSLVSFPSPKFDYSAYESLKTKGIDLISNKDLRFDIVNAYEVDFYYLIKDLDSNLSRINTDYFPLATKHIRFDFNKDLLNPKANPIDYKALLQNDEFINMVSLLAGFRQIGAASSEQIKTEIEALIERIEEEIQRLEGS
ncbi:DUF6090 family protein [Psychroflexus aestuariivivens]|uniref:DUF6090 family protein n=1 Tax=Psychroflexus aestuariivivens TaxID=1795040 RepID=UPI000FDAE27C|nr:DUF6090 family protein [Psychroflexus aestuariivivens]